MAEGKDDPVTSIDYVLMYCAVVGWISEAADADERERLSDLASQYHRWAERAAEQERDEKLLSLPEDLRADLKAGVSRSSRIVAPSEFEQVRAAYAVTPVGSLSTMRCIDMLDFADLAEGWAQTPKLHPLQAARLFGLADGLRDLARAVGADWRPTSEGEPSLTSALLREMRRSA